MQATASSHRLWPALKAHGSCFLHFYTKHLPILVCFFAKFPNAPCRPIFTTRHIVRVGWHACGYAFCSPIAQIMWLSSVTEADDATAPLRLMARASCLSPAQKQTAHVDQRVCIFLGRIIDLAHGCQGLHYLFPVLSASIGHQELHWLIHRWHGFLRSSRAICPSTDTTIKMALQDVLRTHG